MNKTLKNELKLAGGYAKKTFIDSLADKTTLTVSMTAGLCQGLKYKGSLTRGLVTFGVVDVTTATVATIAGLIVNRESIKRAAEFDYVEFEDGVIKGYCHKED